MNRIPSLMLALTASVFSVNAAAGGDAAAGKAAAEKFKCSACHGQDFQTPIDPSYPKLAGQHQDYLEHALIAYQRGADAANGRNNPIMSGQAKALSRQEIQHIAAYLQGLPGTLVVRK